MGFWLSGIVVHDKRKSKLFCFNAVKLMLRIWYVGSLDMFLLCRKPFSFKEAYVLLSLHFGLFYIRMCIHAMIYVNDGKRMRVGCKMFEILLVN